MDLETVRASLPLLTRAALGEKVRLFPMKEGKMAAVEDPGRPVLEDIDARFDTAPEIEQIGGGRDAPERARAISAHASVSFALASLAWFPKAGDQVERVHPVTLATERYRIGRTLEPLPSVVLCIISRV